MTHVKLFCRSACVGQNVGTEGLLLYLMLCLGQHWVFVLIWVLLLVRSCHLELSDLVACIGIQPGPICLLALVLIARCSGEHLDLDPNWSWEMHLSSKSDEMSLQTYLSLPICMMLSCQGPLLGLHATLLCVKFYRWDQTAIRQLHRCGKYAWEI